MAIWYECGRGMIKSTMARGRMITDGYLFCPGPSLSKVTEGKTRVDVRRRGTSAFAINTAYPGVIPDYWAGMDKVECYDRGLWGESFIKFCRGGYQETMQLDGQLIKNFPGVYFLDLKQPGKDETMFNLRGHDINFVWHNNTLAVVLHLMVWMGCPSIHFIGCDMGGYKDYYDNRVLNNESQGRNKRLYKQQVEYLRKMNEIGKMLDIRFISCTEESPINEFMEFIPLQDAWDLSEAKVPAPGGRIYDAHELEKLNEAKRPEVIWAKAIAPKGVVVGCDAKYEWMLKWWFANYRKYNDYPVAFADFGMTDEMKSWCASNGYYIDLTKDINQGKTWFKKPFAILRAPFEKIVWVDIDCEIKGSIASVFDWIWGLALTKDPYNHWIKKPKDEIYATGVVGVLHGSKIIEEWAEACVLGKDRGDQEALNAILDPAKTRIFVMPPIYQWLRLDGDNPDAIIVHWTGENGKMIIKGKIMQDNKT